jgi:hypothetical protein
MLRGDGEGSLNKITRGRRPLFQGQRVTVAITSVAGNQQRVPSWVLGRTLESTYSTSVGPGFWLGLGMTSVAGNQQVLGPGAYAGEHSYSTSAGPTFRLHGPGRIDSQTALASEGMVKPSSGRILNSTWLSHIKAAGRPCQYTASKQLIMFCCPHWGLQM